MRKLAILIAAAVGSAGFLLASMPAGAGDTDEFCEALVGVGEASAPDASGAFDPEVAESIADGMRDAAKRAPKKVKKAMRRLARVYENIEGDDAAGNPQVSVQPRTEEGAAVEVGAKKEHLVFDEGCVRL